MASDHARTDTGLPQLEPGVFTATASIVIDAPREVVWKVLMDWQLYHEWNPFVRNQCVTDAWKRPLPEEQQRPSVGDYLYIYPVHIPPSFDSPKLLGASSTFQRITVLDSHSYQCSWVSAEYPKWMLRTERWQVLVEVDEGDGRKKTRYETKEVFNGPLAYVVSAIVGDGIKKGFVAMAEGLKRRSESV
ncbi:hypothetical protein EDD16DRAFT_1553506 [Pisolithus croceorrhizus]|nr:hypothetical protein EV401DRAFT_1867764 [Pisolithus croceorrhizus]KAI6126291.1 hypothetical protein EDD16DRAFT_1553506 [Pisolithus croceorrhizus]KAI6167602.1 hypothetical protein EDD17DRAFT_1467555 [Pisolithus thermaeus]